MDVKARLAAKFPGVARVLFPGQDFLLQNPESVRDYIRCSNLGLSIHPEDQLSDLGMEFKEGKLFVLSRLRGVVAMELYQQEKIFFGSHNEKNIFYPETPEWSGTYRLYNLVTTEVMLWSSQEKLEEDKHLFEESEKAVVLYALPVRNSYNEKTIALLVQFPYLMGDELMPPVLVLPVRIDTKVFPGSGALKEFKNKIEDLVKEVGSKIKKGPPI